MVALVIRVIVGHVEAIWMAHLERADSVAMIFGLEDSHLFVLPSV